MAIIKNTTTNATSSIKLPVGSNSDRPSSPSLGMMRFNTDIETVEIYDGIDWSRMGYPQSLSLSNVPTTLNETTNRTANITVNATGYPGDTIFYWTISGNVNASDFSQGFTGSVSLTGGISGSTGNIAIEIAQDFTPEGPEVFLIEVRTESLTGTIIETSSSITITDTSIEAPAESWTPDAITATGVNGTTGVNICNIWYRRYIIAWVYTASELQTAFGKNSATISGLRFFVDSQPNNQPLPDYAIGMKNGSFGGANPGNTEYTVVKDPASESFTTGQTKTFEPFDTSFNWTGNDLAIIVAWGQCPSTYNASGQSATGSGTMWYSRTDGAGAYTINADQTGLSESYRPVVQLYG